MIKDPGPSDDAVDPAFYGGVDPRDLPRYSYPDASRATDVPISTIAAWVRGMSYTKPGKTGGFFEPVIRRPTREDSRLSFNNLIEVHVLRVLRYAHDVKLQKIREAIRMAETEHDIPRLLIDPKLRTTAGGLFLDYVFDLVELSVSRQLAMREMLKTSLTRVKVDEHSLLAAFLPLARNPRLADAAPLMVSPFIAFGRPIVQRRGITTAAVATRLNEGESKEFIMDDYRLHEDEFEEAILYEAAA